MTGRRSRRKFFRVGWNGRQRSRRARTRRPSPPGSNGTCGRAPPAGCRRPRGAARARPRRLTPPRREGGRGLRTPHAHAGATHWARAGATSAHSGGPRAPRTGGAFRTRTHGGRGGAEAEATPALPRAPPPEPRAGFRPEHGAEVRRRLPASAARDGAGRRGGGPSLKDGSRNLWAPPQRPGLPDAPLPGDAPGPHFPERREDGRGAGLGRWQGRGRRAGRLGSGDGGTGSWAPRRPRAEGGGRGAGRARRPLPVPSRAPDVRVAFNWTLVPSSARLSWCWSRGRQACVPAASAPGRSRSSE